MLQESRSTRSCPIVLSVLHTYTDLLVDPAERTRRLQQWSTLSTESISPDDERRRTWQVFDWLYRKYAPLLIRSVDAPGLASFADSMESLTPVMGLVTFNMARRALHLAYPALIRTAGIFDTPERRALFSLVLMHGGSHSVQDEGTVLSSFSTCLSGSYSLVQSGSTQTLRQLYDSFDGLLDRMVKR